MQESKSTSTAWVYLALCAGFVFGLGNVIFGINLSQKGIWGSGFIGPASLCIVGLYRLLAQYFSVKRVTGNWIDKADSNYYRVVKCTAQDPTSDEFRKMPDQKGEYEFNWQNLAMVFFTQAMTMLAGLIMVAYCFKFA